MVRLLALDPAPNLAVEVDSPPAGDRNPVTSAAVRVTRRSHDWIARELGYRPFLVLLGLGVFIRIAVMAMYFPAWMQTADAVRFARISPPGMFEDVWMPAGYPAFLSVVRHIVPALWVTIALQHLIGVFVGIALYLTVRRLGAKSWLACIPAGVAFLSGDHVWLEHQIMADSLMTALVAAGLLCTVWGLVPRLDLRWLAAGSALLMCASLSRNVALITLPIVFVCVAFWVRGSLLQRGRALLTVVLPALLVFGVYVGVFELDNGTYLGISDMSGWDLYGRVAPFADCTKFDPPPGTRRLCETTPTEQRMGSLGYVWEESSIGRREFELSPETSGKLGEFARAVIIHQPLSYLKAVAIDTLRYIEPTVGPDRPLSGQPRELLSFGLVDPVSREYLVSALGEKYTGTSVHVHGREILASYQNLFRVGGLLLALFVVFTLVGMVVARGPVRLGVFLFGLTALALYIGPTMTISYDFRYGIPPETFIVVSGTLGFAAVLSRRFPRSMFGTDGARGPRRSAVLPD